MSTEHHLTPAAPWVELRTTTADWDDADASLLKSLLSHVILIRTFEEFVLELASQGLVHGPAHSSIGQEDAAVGSVLALTTGDVVNGSHRGHHQFLSKALHHVAPQGIDPDTDLPAAGRDVLLRTLAEIRGLSRGYCRGRGGSMHLQSMARWSPLHRYRLESPSRPPKAVSRPSSATRTSSLSAKSPP